MQTMLSLLEAERFAEARERLRGMVQRKFASRPTAAPLPANVIITGPPRVGKTLLAAALARRTGAYVIGADRIREWYCMNADPVRREASRRTVFEGVLTAASGGIIIEGDDFISENRGFDTGVEPFSLERLARWQGLRLAEVVVLGCPDCSVEEKVLGLRRWREKGGCWTTGHSSCAEESSLPDMARRLIEVSRELRHLSAAAGLKFLSVGRGDFDEAIEQAASALANDTAIRPRLAAKA